MSPIKLKFSAIVCALVIVGCSESTETQTKTPVTPAEASGPGTYAEAVENLQKLDSVVRSAFAAKDEEKAHGPLHDVGHVLEDVVALAAKAEMTDEQRSAVQKAVDGLFDAYGAVDETMHGGDGKTYDEVTTEIDAALTVLKNAMSKPDGAESDETSE